MTTQMNDNKQLRAIWEDLAREQSPGIVKKAVDIMCCLKAFCTYNSQDHNYGIAFSFNKSIDINILPFRDLAEIKVLLLPDNSFPDSNLLLIQLIEKEGRVVEIFETICTNIITVIKHASSEREAIHLVITQMKKWKELFSRKTLNTLTPSEQLGLLGELYFLRKLLDTGLDSTLTTNYWVGPNSAPHDFQASKWSVEVKAVGLKTQDVVNINGELQLDESSTEKLFLYKLIIEENNTDGVTLPEVVDDVRTKLSQNANALLDVNNKLMSIGYFDSDKDLYNHRHYHVRNEKYYHIQGEFPRIKAMELRPGVSNLKYSINTQDCVAYVLSEDELLNTILQYERN